MQEENQNMQKENQNMLKESQNEEELRRICNAIKLQTQGSKASTDEEDL